MYSFLFFLFGYVLLPFTAASQPQAGFYIPPDTVSAMQEPEKIPEIRKLPPNYNRNVAPDTAKQRATTSPKPLKNTTPRQPKRVSYPQQQTGLTATQPAVVNYKKTPGSQNMREAPIDAILAKQPLPKKRLEHYKKHIIRSFALLPKDLNTILQKELRNIDSETKRMQQIKVGWKQQTFAYKLANYQLIPQINSGINASRKNYKKRKEIFAGLLKNAPADKYISVIESTDDLFDSIHRTTQSIPNASPKMKDTMVRFLGSNMPSIEKTGFYFISIFDYEHNHVFSYRRTHVDSNQNRRILAAPSGNKKIDEDYQKLFDDYRADLRRIGYGLDITNPTLLRQIGEMKNQVITVEF